MATENVIGLAMGLDVTSLKQGLDEAKQRIKEADSEFKASTGNMSDWANNVDGLNAKIKQLSTRFTEQQRILSGYEAAQDEAVKKQQQLQKEYDDTVKSQGENSKEAIKLKAKLDAQNKAVRDLNVTINDQKATVGKTEVELNKYKNKLVEVENETDDAKKETKESTKALKDAETQAVKSGEGFTILKGVISNLVTQGINALGRALGSVKDSFFDVTAWADDLLTTSTQTGLTTEKLQELQYASQLVDVEVETMTKSMAKNIKSMTNAQKGSKDMVSAYKQLGVEVTNADGSLRNSQDVYWETIEALGKVADETTRDSLAMTILGKSAQEINPLIEAGADTLQQLSEEAHNVGYVMGEEDVQLLGQFDDMVQRMKTGITSLKNNLILLLAKNENFKTFMESLTMMLQGNFKGGAEGIVGVITNIKNKIMEALPSLLSSIVAYLPTLFQNLMNSISQRVALFNQLLPQILAVVVQIITSLVAQLPSLIQMLSDALLMHLPIMLNTAMILFGALIDALPVVLEALIVALPTILQTLTTFLTNSIPMLLEACVMLLNALVDAIPIILGVLVPTLPLIIQSITDFLMNNLGTILQAGVTLFNAIINAIPLILQPLVGALPSIIQTITTTLVSKLPMIIQAAVDIFSAIIEAIPIILPLLITEIPKIADAIRETLLEIDWLDMGLQILKGILEGMTTAGDVIWKSIKAVGNSMLEGIKNFFKIKSPSKLMEDEIGMMLGLGVGEGIVGSTKKVLQDVKQFDNAILNGLKLDKQVALAGASSGGSVGGSITNTSNINLTQNITTVGQTTAKALARYTDNLLDLNKVRGYR